MSNIMNLQIFANLSFFQIHHGNQSKVFHCLEHSTPSRLQSKTCCRFLLTSFLGPNSPVQVRKTCLLMAVP